MNACAVKTFNPQVEAAYRGSRFPHAYGGRDRRQREIGECLETRDWMVASTEGDQVIGYRIAAGQDAVQVEQEWGTDGSIRVTNSFAGNSLREIAQAAIVAR